MGMAGISFHHVLRIISLAAITFVFALSIPHTEAADKKRVFVVSSYHREYLWSQSTQRGLSQAMIDYGYLDNRQQADALAREDKVESKAAVIRKVWMNSKKRNTHRDFAIATARIMAELHAFKPDVVLLGDDNATNYIGNQLLDTSVPVVFWGVNGLPLKYGLVDSMDGPGHNVTGVWQSGYHRESLEVLKRIVPSARTFAILASDSVTARPNVKVLQRLAERGELPLKLVDVVMTNSFAEFRERTTELAKTVDAFFVLNHDTMLDEELNHVSMLSVGRWYLENIRKPDVSHEDQFVVEGILLSAPDMGFNQSYRAFEMAYDILEQGLNPSRMRTITPARGPIMVNAERAKMLGLDLKPHMDIFDQIIPEAAALHTVE